MVFVIVDSVVMLASSVSATSRMLPVFANSSMTSTDMTPLFPVLVQVCNTRPDVDFFDGNQLTRQSTVLHCARPIAWNTTAGQSARAKGTALPL